ncbi:MAG TPA: PKD domain-containing protein [Bacteroidetes bacterium]|nr:PKD domain-containing protein [Bacteroidota bacterium]
MKYLVTLTLLFFIQSTGLSKHIIGGVISYECLGGGTYKFTMKMYRDCNDPTGAGFDQNAAFTIFKGNASTEDTVVFVSPQSIEPVAPPPIPCLEIPANLCVEEGIYEFEYTFADWPSTESYHISYQRCCRNVTIVNIQNPDDVGATFTIEILPASQAACNNSPVFNTFPPIIICVDEPLSYDHSAFDSEGDQLVYELCSPLLGGAPPGAGGTDPCMAVAPNPACPPPYDEAVFINPPYTELFPMGGDPVVTIDATTGLLSGRPNVTGQFVFAVCVSEYRNGELMSVIRRDFQFNVASCEAIVSAEVDALDIELENDEYFLKICNGLEIQIENKSTDPSTVNELLWEFSSVDTSFSFDTWDLEALFPGAGSYDGVLRLNPDDEICGDSAILHIDIFPELVAGFSYNYDTCEAGPVAFVDESFIDGTGELTASIWSFGDGAVDSVHANPLHVYAEPQIYPVELEVWDANGCRDTVVNNVVYQPVPALILVRPDDTLSCPPVEITFNNLSSPIDNSYQFFWEFGDGGTSMELSPSHIYTGTGAFDVGLEIVSPIGCVVDTVFSRLINLLDPPVASFDYEPQSPSNLNPEVTFFDASSNAVNWKWFVNGQFTWGQQDFVYTFRDTGLQEVQLIVTHPELCRDTLVRFIDVVPEVTFFLPNAFTPNEDSENEFFLGTGILPGITAYKMEIWDRWGSMIFETNEPKNGWNGQVNNTGKQVQAGVYIVKVNFIGPRGTPHEYKGYATVIR